MTTATMKVRVLRTNGTEETHHVPRGSIEAIRQLLGCETIDTVNLRDGHVMAIDDVGLVDGKPRNEAATSLYHSVTRPGDHFIAGDAAIVLDADFA